MAIQKIVGTLQVSGKLANTVYMRRNGQTISRALVTPANPRTIQQMTNRVGMSNYVLLYRALRHVIVGAFSDKKVGETDYNAFVRSNKAGYGINSVIVPRTKEQAKQSIGCLAPVQISSGILARINAKFGGVGDEPYIVQSGVVTAGATLEKCLAALKQYVWGARPVNGGFILALANDDEGGILSSDYVEIPVGANEAYLTDHGFEVYADAVTGLSYLMWKGYAGSLKGFRAVACYASQIDDNSKVLVSTSSLFLDVDATSAYDIAVSQESWNAAVASYNATVGAASRSVAKIENPINLTPSITSGSYAGHDLFAPVTADQLNDTGTLSLSGANLTDQIMLKKGTATPVLLSTLSTGLVVNPAGTGLTAQNVQFYIGSTGSPDPAPSAKTFVFSLDGVTLLTINATV